MSTKHLIQSNILLYWKLYGASGLERNLLNVMDRPIGLIIIQLADDPTLFIFFKLNESPFAFQSINQVSRASGLQLNVKKCEILSLHERTLHSISNIQIKGRCNVTDFHQEFCEKFQLNCSVRSYNIIEWWKLLWDWRRHHSPGLR